MKQSQLQRECLAVQHQEVHYFPLTYSQNVQRVRRCRFYTLLYILTIHLRPNPYYRMIYPIHPSTVLLAISRANLPPDGFGKGGHWTGEVSNDRVEKDPQSINHMGIALKISQMLSLYSIIALWVFSSLSGSEQSSLFLFLFPSLCSLTPPEAFRGAQNRGG